MSMTSLKDRSGSHEDLKALTLTRGQPADAKAWDEFVEGHPEGRFCHLWGFGQVLKRVYGYRCVYLNIRAGGELVGIFPSIALTHGSPRLISQPFNEYGGPLTKDLSADQYRQLTQALLRVAQLENCGSIEIRGGIGCEAAEQAGGWVKKPLHSYAVLRLNEGGQLWRDSLTNEARKGVNRARRAGLTAEVRRGTRAVDSPFYKLYLLSMKRLGVPPHPARFFTHLADALGDRLVGAWVMSQAEPAAILLGSITGQRIQIWVTASDSRWWSERPNDLAHWELINWASAEGLRVFDFGAARYAGQIQFKKKWGVSLNEYCYYLVGPPNAGSTLKIRTVDSSSKIMTVMAGLWRRFVPLPLTPVLGPPIRKYLTK
jgi:CelD/BcsL family acetyltransferase involved in cellulose biosynthesis